MKNTLALSASFLLTILTSAQAMAMEFNCRNEDPHIIASLELQSGNPKVVAGNVVVGFMHGVLACPLDARVSSSLACRGQYRTPEMEEFHAELVLRTNKIAILHLQLPRTSGGQTIAVTCFQK